MSQAAIGAATRDVQDDCSSVLSIRSRGLQLSMAASLTAHVALAATIMSTTPASMASFGDPNALQVTFVDLAPAEPSPKLHAGFHPKPTVQPLATLKNDTAAKYDRPAPLPVVDHAELALKEAARPDLVPRHSRVASAEPQSDKAVQAAQASPPSLSSANVSPAAQSHGSQPAAIAKAGAEDNAEKTVITDPRFRVKPKPAVYPKRARELGQEGEALVHARLDPDGDPEEVLIWRSSGFVLLDNAALAAVRRWQFEPARWNGHPTVAWVEIPVRFQLN